MLDLCEYVMETPFDHTLEYDLLIYWDGENIEKMFISEYTTKSSHQYNKHKRQLWHFSKDIFSTTFNELSE